MISSAIAVEPAARPNAARTMLIQRFLLSMPRTPGGRSGSTGRLAPTSFSSSWEIGFAPPTLPARSPSSHWQPGHLRASKDEKLRT
jgi:hypothetical protein